jgi:hypothetical protein
MEKDRIMVITSLKAGAAFMDRISGRKIIMMIAPPKPVTAWTKPPRRAEKATTNIPIIKASFPDSVQQKELKRTVSATALPVYIN